MLCYVSFYECIRKKDIAAVMFNIMQNIFHVQEIRKIYKPCSVSEFGQADQELMLDPGCKICSSQKMCVRISDSLNSSLYDYFSYN